MAILSNTIIFLIGNISSKFNNQWNIKRNFLSADATAHNRTRLNVTFVTFTGSMRLSIGEENEMTINDIDPLRLAVSPGVFKSKTHSISSDLCISIYVYNWKYGVSLT